MDFTRTKRRELQALCRQHGLASRGSKADLAASLSGALAAAAAAAAAENMVEMVVGKGCLKQSGDGTKSGSTSAAKKVTFALEEKEESGKALLATAVSRRGRRQEHVESGGDSSGEGIAGEVYADARVKCSTKNAVNLCSDSGIESSNNIADAEEESEVIGAAVDRKQKRKNAKGIATNAQARISHTGTRKSSLSGAADTRSVESRNNPAEPVEEGEVILESGHTKWKRETTGKGKTRVALPETEISGRGRRHKHTEERGDGFVAEGVAKVGADARVTRSKSNALNLSADSGLENLNIPAGAEEEGEVVQEAIDSKRKRKTRENAHDISANAHAGISCRSTRSSSLSGGAVLFCTIVEKKRGRKKAGDCKDELGVEEKAAEVQDLATSPSAVIVESKRSRRKGEDCEPAVQKSAKVEVSGTVTRSCSVNAAVALPIIVENKRKRATEDVHLDRKLPTVPKSHFPRNYALVTSLRTRAVQIKNSVLEETHVGKNLEKMRQPSGPAIRRHQQPASSVEEEEQVTTSCKYSPLHETSRGEEFRNAKRRCGEATRSKGTC